MKTSWNVNLTFQRNLIPIERHAVRRHRYFR